MSVSSLNEIDQFLHCGRCLDEWKENTKIKTKQSPRDYSKLSIGFTKSGLQVWCNRHQCNVVHIDFQGIQHPANFTRQPTKKELV